MKIPAMIEVFQKCQNSMQGHKKLLIKLVQVYKKTSFSEFWPEFLRLMKYSMIVFEREPAVERTVDFITKFVTSVTTEESKESDPNATTDEVSQNHLLLEVFDFILQHHSASEKAVRFRCCQMVNKLLNNLGENALIDDDLYDQIFENMIERMRDVVPLVRLQAVMALTRLQDPHDDNCPIIKAYLFMISADPNPDVRRFVLKSIAPSTKTLPAMIERTRDVKDTVRKMAYTVLGEKVHIKALSIANRVQLLHDGLTDRSEMVKEACATRLLQAWLCLLEENVLKLLSMLDVETSEETCQLALSFLFKPIPPAELVNKFDLINDKILIPLDKLTCESSMYWQALCKFIQEKGADADEELEKILPNCVEFCHYVAQFLDELKNINDLDIQMEKEFILKQLLNIIDYMDLADQASRRAVERLFHDMLLADHVGHHLVKYIVPRICKIQNNTDASLRFLTEVISDIREPITMVQKGPNEDERRQNDIKIAGIRVKLNQAKEELDQCVKEQDFNKAAEIKKLIADLDGEKSLLLEAVESINEEVRTERTDPGTVRKCMTIFGDMMETLEFKSLHGPTIQTLIETFVLAGMQNEDERVRAAATRALGLCCLFDSSLVLQHIALFMQASKIDVEEVSSMALTSIFDILHLHGLEVITENPKSNQTSEDKDVAKGDDLDVSLSSEATESSQGQEAEEDNRKTTATNLIAYLSAFLSDENATLRGIAAEGLAKLLLSGRIVSSKILSHLILLWYNPVTEDDVYLRNCLGSFLPLYALSSRTNQEIVEEAFLPTLKTIVNAPSSSPLAEVDVENTAELLIHLTNSSRLLQNQDKEINDNPSHANIAMQVCNEMITSPDSINLTLWVKILNQLELFVGDEITNKELLVLTGQILDVIKVKQCIKSVEKFRAKLEKLIPEPSTPEPSLQEQEAQLAVPLPEEKPSGESPQKTESGGRRESIDKQEINESMAEADSFFHEPKLIRRNTSKLSESANVSKVLDILSITEDGTSSDGYQSDSKARKKASNLRRKSKKVVKEEEEESSDNSQASPEKIKAKSEKSKKKTKQRSPESQKNEEENTKSSNDGAQEEVGPPHLCESVKETNEVAEESSGPKRRVRNKRLSTKKNVKALRDQDKSKESNIEEGAEKEKEVETNKSQEKEVETDHSQERESGRSPRGRKRNSRNSDGGSTSGGSQEKTSPRGRRGRKSRRSDAPETSDSSPDKSVASTESRKRIARKPDVDDVSPAKIPSPQRAVQPRKSKQTQNVDTPKSSKKSSTSGTSDSSPSKSDRDLKRSTRRSEVTADAGDKSPIKKKERKSASPAKTLAVVLTDCEENKPAPRGKSRAQEGKKNVRQASKQDVKKGKPKSAEENKKVQDLNDSQSSIRSSRSQKSTKLTEQPPSKKETVRTSTRKARNQVIEDTDSESAAESPISSPVRRTTRGHGKSSQSDSEIISPSPSPAISTRSRRSTGTKNSQDESQGVSPSKKIIAKTGRKKASNHESESDVMSPPPSASQRSSRSATKKGSQNDSDEVSGKPKKGSKNESGSSISSPPPSASNRVSRSAARKGSQNDSADESVFASPSPVRGKASTARQDRSKATASTRGSTRKSNAATIEREKAGNSPTPVSTRSARKTNSSVALRKNLSEVMSESTPSRRGRSSQIADTTPVTRHSTRNQKNK